ncbi:MAG: Endoribonuclease YbeY [Chloroflexi bacterium]|nr:Endoribonuclease YbeY [Chloroflexota bacterium]
MDNQMILFEVKEQFQGVVYEEILEEAVVAALQAASPAETNSLTVLVIGNEQMRSLNRQYRGIDSPTDVLSFTAGYTDPDTGEHYLGDVLISYPMAEQQAQTRGHAVEGEIQLLVAHGVLHLLGHDHATEDEQSRMWSLQAKILAKLGLDIEMGGDE